MKTKTPKANHEVAEEACEEYIVVLVAETACDSLVGQKHEYQIRDRIDNFCRVVGEIIVLGVVSQAQKTVKFGEFYLLAPIQC